ncbi:hypothetical protein SPRG_11017 [Saprolegnia parasitica CBS 223.65]|uniref:Uncharacterized protein n=1 Tax=Saprolegnia parasitica (strain CBS 223.65) TaxID=695850 RepID=A0A067BWT2_SAPPC|nr:hypothetical protein SPRG_11017 [Saprolegnia parasitica CBS 223.65]KDO22703.1 hypothetical protein SPRG_11017 [Saprolegnia parasitica CBS 223.65]|eukprot:XP_012206613.1 hypothetical protein SPRG_11017 [Saprolegnia parasitica CBS 223.65]
MMGVVKVVAWIAAVVGVVYMSLMESIAQSEAHISFVKAALEKLRAEHVAVDLEPLDTSLLGELEAKHAEWRREWASIKQRDVDERQEVLAHWSATKQTILDDVAAKTSEVDAVRANERRAMHILREWSDVRKAIASTTAQIASIQSKIEYQERQTAAKQRLAADHADAIEQLRWAQQARERMFENEKLAAEESITRRKFWLRALFLAAGLVTFGAVMIALDKDRKKGTNLRLYDYNHGSIDDE